jgi:hypothetical protein
MQPSNPRLVLGLSALFAVLIVTALFFFRVFVAPFSSWRQFSFRVVASLVLISTTLALALGVWFGRWSAQFFAIDFIVGAAVENRAMAYCVANDHLRSTPGT